MKYDNAYFLEMIDKLGLEEAISRINIDDIDDLNIKIICRTLKHSQETLIELLSESIVNQEKLVS